MFENILGVFFGRPYHSNGAKTSLDETLSTQLNCHEQFILASFYQVPISQLYQNKADCITVSTSIIRSGKVIFFFISYDCVYTVHDIFSTERETFVGSYNYHRYRPLYVVYVENLFSFFRRVSRTLSSIYDGAFLQK